MQPNTGEACRTKTLRRLLFSCYYFRFNSGGKWLNASLSIFLLVLCHCCAAHCARLKRFIVFPRCSSSLLSERDGGRQASCTEPFFRLGKTPLHPKQKHVHTRTHAKHAPTHTQNTYASSTLSPTCEPLHVSEWFGDQ